MRRVLGIALVAAVLAVGGVADTAEPAAAAGAGAGAGAGTIVGQVDAGVQPVQWFEQARLWSPAVFAAAPPAGVCATTVAVNNLVIDYSLESPADGPLPAGALYSVGSFAPGGTFGGAIAGVCYVTGTIGNGALFTAMGV